MGFFLFVLVNAALFLRPGDLFPGLGGVQFYEPLIVACLVVSFPKILPLLRIRSLADQPITLCVFGLFFAIVASQLAHGFLWGARKGAFDFGKVVLYYLLLVALLDTPGRLRWFLFWLTCFTVLLTAAALLHHHEVVRIPTIASWEEQWIDRNEDEPGEGAIELRRLRSTGLFLDPNDFCLILLVAAASSLYFLADRRLGWGRLAWVGPLVLFGYAFSLTESRGGLIALLAGLLVLFQARFGWRRAMALAAISLPLVLMLFAGRQTGISVETESGQGRLRNWSYALTLFRQEPLFGIGYGNFAEVSPELVHNSFLECHTELGFFGGTLFIGAFFYALWVLARLGNVDDREVHPEAVRLRPYMMAMIAAYATGILALSRIYIVPTYMVLGLATVYFRLAEAPTELLLFNRKLVLQCTAVSASFVLATYGFVRVFILWQ